MTCSYFDTKVDMEGKQYDSDPELTSYAVDGGIYDHYVRCSLYSWYKEIPTRYWEERIEKNTLHIWETKVKDRQYTCMMFIGN